MTGSKGGAAGQSTKRKPATKGVRGGVAGVSGSGNGGSGIGVELDGVAVVKFIGVRRLSPIVEIKKYLAGLDFYKTVNDGKLLAAIIHDLARVHVNPNCPVNRLNIRKVGHCIMKDAQISRQFLVKFTEQNPLKPADWLSDLLSTESETLRKKKFDMLKEQIVEQGRQCFLELKTLITGDREQHVQGRRRKDLDPIPPPLPDDCAQAWKDGVAEVVAEFPSPKGKLLDAKGEADKRALITSSEVPLQTLEPVQDRWDLRELEISGEFSNVDLVSSLPVAPVTITDWSLSSPLSMEMLLNSIESQWTDTDALQARYNN